MEDIRLVYENLTGVNIDEQRRLWDERGKGYYGEYLVFNQLYQYVQGDCKVLMNVNIPTHSGKTTEIDLLMLHETGIYVFEIKHHKGTIYGDSEGKVWTQYFRTSPNATFNNPLKQNAYHIAALKTIFPNAPLKSIIVFTNDNVTLRVIGNKDAAMITRLGNLMCRLDGEMHEKPIIYTRDQLNDMFMQLLPYSPMKAVTVEEGGVAVPFYDYLENIRTELIKAKTRFENDIKKLEQEKEDFRRRKKTFSPLPPLSKSPLPPVIESAPKSNDSTVFQGEYSASLARAKEAECRYKDALEHTQKKAHSFRWKMIAVIVLSLILTGCACLGVYQKFEKDYAEMIAEYEKTFLRIDDMSDDLIASVNSMIDVSDIVLESSPDIVNAVSFSAKLTNTSQTYGIQLTKDSTYVVILKDGTIREYPVFGEHLQYNSFANRIGPNYNGIYTYSGVLKTATFTKITSVYDISYIKLTDISLWSRESYGRFLEEGIDLELYERPV